MPREIYFLGFPPNDFENQDVYSISFDTKANQVMNTQLRAPRFEVVVNFPLKRNIQNVQDLEMWFLVTTLSLLESDSEVRASLVPELVWKQCFKSDPHFLDKKNRKIPPLFWP